MRTCVSNNLKTLAKRSFLIVLFLYVFLMLGFVITGVDFNCSLSAILSETLFLTYLSMLIYLPAFVFFFPLSYIIYVIGSLEIEVNDQAVVCYKNNKEYFQLPYSEIIDYQQLDYKYYKRNYAILYLSTEKITKRPSIFKILRRDFVFFEINDKDSSIKDYIINRLNQQEMR